MVPVQCASWRVWTDGCAVGDAVPGAAGRGVADPGDGVAPCAQECALQHRRCYRYIYRRLGPARSGADSLNYFAIFYD